MKIVACIRTLNEEDHIQKCCEAYQFCDQILIADGGSTDRTVEIAKFYPKVEVRYFTKMVECSNGIWRNPDGEHLQFLYDWAVAEGADWTIAQDCDQRPNKYLKENIRDILSISVKDFILVTQIYVIGGDAYLPRLSRDGDTWWQGLWAWRTNIHLKVIDRMPHFEFSLDGVKSFDVPKLNRHQTLLPPYCFMHFGWETEDMIQKHLEYYRKSNLIPQMRHPLSFGGMPEPLLEWMIE
jgi:glycosyltransferase involved in cell wall biosynthesis